MSIKNSELRMDPWIYLLEFVVLYFCCIVESLGEWQQS